MPSKKINFTIDNLCLTNRHFWLFLANVWFMVGIAMPTERCFDALVCFAAGIICIYKA